MCLQLGSSSCKHVLHDGNITNGTGGYAGMYKNSTTIIIIFQQRKFDCTFSLWLLVLVR